MFLFRHHKQITHKQASLIGFVLALMSLLSTVVILTVGSLFSAWLYANLLFDLGTYLLMFGFTFFMAVQGLILFGFPLYYAQDKKSHMTGFQILLYALFWMVVIVAVLGLLGVMISGSPAPVFPSDIIPSEYTQ
ncbi:hypothetical protein HOD30_03035 [Candidatus Peregrinibacteria bacterium]|jgi:hypothetical protein|nr:hypothetical protein [Candidatus Peregrinibacteria bacterium]MBT4632068.1 hypothetical protein [Candidatus Peregrinibacteria bacterium]MBT5516301.1 hypothetical protein [Candidatus Peregrinibacteria bacterium]MBT5823722.1 hypothetical protein [Candidatus Peregrinibacteria bacterium]